MQCVEDRSLVGKKAERLVGAALTHDLSAGVPGAAVAVEVSAAREHKRADTRVQSGCERGVKAAHRVSKHCNAFGIDFGQARSVADRADDITDHEAAHARGGFQARQYGVVGTRIGEMLGVTLFFADGIEGYNDRAGACVEKSGVDLVPG